MALAWPASRDFVKPSSRPRICTYALAIVTENVAAKVATYDLQTSRFDAVKGRCK